MRIGMGTIINYNDELFDIDKEIKMLTFKRIMTYIIIKAIYDSEYNLALLRPNHTKIFDTDNKYFKVMVYCENYEETEDDGEISTFKCSFLFYKDNEISISFIEDFGKIFEGLILKVDIEVPDSLEIKSIEYNGDIFIIKHNNDFLRNDNIRSMFVRKYKTEIDLNEIDPEKFYIDFAFNSMKRIQEKEFGLFGYDKDLLNSKYGTFNEDIISNFSNKPLKGGLLKDTDHVVHYDYNDNSILPRIIKEFDVIPSFLKKKEDDNNESNESDNK